MAKKLNFIKYEEEENLTVTETNRILKYELRFISAHHADYEHATAVYITLYGAGNKAIGYITFFEDWVDSEENQIFSNGTAKFSFPISKYPYVLDMLRNESPVYLENEPKEKIVRLVTRKEAVGEGE